MSILLNEKNEKAFETLLIHGGVDGDPHTGAVTVPIYQTSTYKFKRFGEHSGYDYSRAGNPTREALEKLIAEMEMGEAGFAFASGMAAITAVLTLFQSGDTVLISDNIYGGTFRVLDKIFIHFDIRYKIVDTSNLKALEEALDPSVKAILIETPTNPLLGISDIRQVSAFAKDNGLLTIVDNTFMTPYHQKPLTLGADIVLHSGTKYLGGHSDLIAGLVVAKDPVLAERLYFIQKSTGGVLGPNDSWLLIRGIKTLAVRMDRHEVNTRRIADHLRAHEGVKRVYYPGFEDHPGHETHLKQSSGFGGMISFELKEGHDLYALVDALNIITFGESLGGVESLLSHPASMTHGSIPYEIRQEMGISEELLRLSVGIENADDLIREIDRIIEAAKRG